MLIGQGFTKPLCWLLVLSLAGCASAPKTFSGGSIKPEMPVGIGDEVLLQRVSSTDILHMIVSAKSTTLLSGKPVDQPDTTIEIRWNDIRHLEIKGASYSNTENILMAFVALLLFASAFGDHFQLFKF